MSFLFVRLAGNTDWRGVLGEHHPSVVGFPEDAANHLADAVYFGFTLAVGFALGRVVCEVGQGYVQGFVREHLQGSAW